MRASVPLALPSNKGLLNRSRRIAGAKAHSGRPLRTRAKFEVAEPTGGTTPLTAAEPKRFFRLLADRSHILLSQTANG